MVEQQTRIRTRFRAVDEHAARQLADLLRATAAAAAAEQGHLSYEVLAVREDSTTLYVDERWASADDARRHADLVLGDGGVDRVLLLLRERLDTVTLVPIASSTPPGTEAVR